MNYIKEQKQIQRPRRQSKTSFKHCTEIFTIAPTQDNKKRKRKEQGREEEYLVIRLVLYPVREQVEDSGEQLQIVMTMLPVHQALM